MRLPVLLVALALASLLPVPAQAQAAHFLEDTRGDVQATASSGALPSAVPRDTLDLLALDIVEDAESFTFTTTSAALPTESSTDFEGDFVNLWFSHNHREFYLQVLLAQPSIEPDVVTWFFQRDDPTDPWSQVFYSRETTVADRAAGTLTTPIAREFLADAMGAAPVQGRVLEGIHLSTATRASGQLIQVDSQGMQFPFAVGDAMPDGGATAAWPVQIGPAQTGHAALSSPEPFRASNGESTTFVYNVTAANSASEDDTYELAVGTVPHGYTVNLPLQAVNVPAQGNQSFPVLLTMPFGHAHGEAVSFVLEARSTSDPGSVGRIELGVRFLPVPQPAGHHDSVFFHSHQVDTLLLPPVVGTFNTLDQDDTDSGQPIGPNGLRNTAAGSSTRTWILELNPVLALGLHVDSNKTGALAATIATPRPLMGASVAARLCAGPELWDCVHELATFPATAPADLQAGQEVDLDGPFVPAAGSPRVPFQKGSTLWLELNLTYTDPGLIGTNVGPETPTLQPGGYAILPLQEWHDEVTGAAAFGGPGLAAVGSQERKANPGRAARFDVDVLNPLGEDLTVGLEVSGTNADWAHLQDARVHVPAHGSTRTSILVHVPTDTDDGTVADLVLQAASTEHPEALGLLRLVTETDTDQTYPDDAAGSQKGKSSPGAGLVPAAALLALAAYAVRRRR